MLFRRSSQRRCSELRRRPVARSSFMARHKFKRHTHFQIIVASRMQQGGERETMTTEIFPLYSRLDPEITARLRARALAAKATTAQSALEYILFAIRSEERRVGKGCRDRW